MADIERKVSGKALRAQVVIFFELNMLLLNVASGIWAVINCEVLPFCLTSVHDRADLLNKFACDINECVL